MPEVQYLQTAYSSNAGIGGSFTVTWNGQTSGALSPTVSAASLALVLQQLASDWSLDTNPIQVCVCAQLNACL